MVVILVSALSHAMQKIQPDDIHRFLTELTADFENMHGEICRKIDAEGDFSDADKDTIVRFAKEFAEKFYV
jgi:F0F1-type ATP synthase alpha subunit